MEPTTAFLPFTRQWDGYDHYHFIQWAIKYYRANRHDGWGNPYRQERHEMWDVVSRLWDVGKSHYVLDLSPEEFWQRLDPVHRNADPKSYNHKYKRPKEYKDYYPRNGAHFRCRVPLRITRKKVLAEKEVQRREWKKKKRDRRKARNTYKTYAKLRSNRDFRRYEKQEIQKGRYTNLYKNKRKDYFDPWDWS